MVDPWNMKLFIDKYPEFISIKTERGGIPDKRVVIIRPGEHLILPNLKLSYMELQSGPQIIRFDPEKKD